MNSNLTPSSVHPTRNPFKPACHDAFVLSLASNLQQRVADENRIPYFLTITYLDSVQFPLTAASASHNLDRFHKCLLKYLCQSSRFHRPYFRAIEPVIYAFLDVPNSKSKRFKPNTIPEHTSTFHHHCILLADQRHVPLLDKLTDKRAADDFAFQCRSNCKVKSIDLQRINETQDDLIHVVDYCSAHARKRFSDEYAYQVYPKAKSELH